jgi:hypothetical protein
MAEQEQTTPQTDTEGQGKAEEQPATTQPEEAKTSPEPSTDDLNPKTGETLEAYAARVRSEVNWRDKQINRQHRKIKESETQAIQRAEAAQPPPQQAAPQAQGAPPQAPRPQVAPPSGIDPNTLAAARRQVLVERTTEQLNRNPEWTAASANFQKAGGIPEPLLDDVMATDNPAEVLIALGKDPNKYQELLDMSENRRRAVIYQIGMKLEKPEPKKEVKKPSEAPAPVQRLQEGGSAAMAEGDIDIYDPKFATPEHDDAWFRMRAQQKANSRGRPWSYGGKGGSGAPKV